jgi:preprotein translocase subunit SecG
VHFYLSLTLIVVSTVMCGLVMLQTRGSGLGSMFGGDGGVYKTRRGMEKSVFNMTILFAAVFLVVSFVTVFVQ